MLWVYVPRGTSLDRIPVAADVDVPESAVWFDLVNPNSLEDKIVERQVGIAVPTREEMQEIEVTSRLYVENGARYMTATLMCQSDTDTPKTTPVTFILSGHRLITVRYDEPRPFMIVGNKLARTCPAGANGESVLMDLLDAVIDRSADILERIGAEVDQVSHDIFEPEADHKRSHHDILKVIGRKGDLTSKVRESLVSIGRVLLYLANEADSMRWAKETRSQLRGMQRDVQSLSDHATYLSNKITFLLDAVIDRAADILERIGVEVDQVSHEIFEPEESVTERSKSYQIILKKIGRKGDLTSKVRESLVSIGRLLLYLANEADSMRWAKEPRAQLRGMQRDVHSLSDHAAYLTHKIQFLLDALLGMVTLDQNNVIKIFSVAAVVLLPPSLVGTIYGMNFKHMPELEWTWGYPLSLVLILLAAVLPYYFFKWKKWL